MGPAALPPAAVLPRATRPAIWPAAPWPWTRSGRSRPGPPSPPWSAAWSRWATAPSCSYYSAGMARWATLILGVVLLVSLTGSWVQLRPQQRDRDLASRSCSAWCCSSSPASRSCAWPRWRCRRSRSGSDSSACSAGSSIKARVVASWLADLPRRGPAALQRHHLRPRLPAGDRHARAADRGLHGLPDRVHRVQSAGSSSATPGADDHPQRAAALRAGHAHPRRRCRRWSPARAIRGPLSGDVEIQHATFRYQADGPLILRDVSIRIKSGEFVAFVGPSGSGKSTLLRLLLGFEALEGGAIFYDGQELGGLDVQAVRRQMGVVLQSGRLDVGRYLHQHRRRQLRHARGGVGPRLAWPAWPRRSRPCRWGCTRWSARAAARLSGGQRQRLLDRARHRGPPAHPAVRRSDQRARQPHPGDRERQPREASRRPASWSRTGSPRSSTPTASS